MKIFKKKLGKTPTTILFLLWIILEIPSVLFIINVFFYPWMHDFNFFFNHSFLSDPSVLLISPVFGLVLGVVLCFFTLLDKKIKALVLALSFVSLMPLEIILLMVFVGSA